MPYLSQLDSSHQWLISEASSTEVEVGVGVGPEVGPEVGYGVLISESGWDRPNLLFLYSKK